MADPSFLLVFPESPVTETWQWLTDIITTVDGKEQRIALRTPPRISQQLKLVELTQNDINARFKEFLSGLVDSIRVPLAQYGTGLTGSSGIGTSDVSFDPSYGDIRDGDHVVLTNGTTYVTAEVLTVGVAGATLKDPLSSAVDSTWFIVPTILSRVDNQQSIRRVAVHDVATIGVTCTSVETRDLSRPNSLVVVERFEGYGLLDQVPIAEEDIQDTFDTGAEVFDFGTGISAAVSDWAYTKTNGQRRYLIHRTSNPSEMDWWRDFLALVKGGLNPFLVPTHRADLSLYAFPSNGYSTLVYAGSDYANLYYQMESYQRLYLHTQNGPLSVSVSSVSVDGNGNSVCHLSSPAPLGEGWRQILGTSFLTKCRLASDEVVFEHSEFESIITIQIKTVRE